MAESGVSEGKHPQLEIRKGTAAALPQPRGWSERRIKSKSLIIAPPAFGLPPPLKWQETEMLSFATLINIRDVCGQVFRVEISLKIPTN